MKNVTLRIGRFIYRKLGISRNAEFANRPFSNIMAAEKANQVIADCILKGEPVMISRFGTPESNCLLNFLEIQKSNSRNFLERYHAILQNKRKVWDEDMKTALIDLVGFFPLDDMSLLNFSNYYIEQIKKTDFVGVWGFVPGETYLINQYCPHAVKYDPLALEPYFFPEPWSAALTGKKVLVIHPFSNSLSLQYNNRINIFPNTNILPEFELKTITAVQSIAGNQTEYKTWFDALKWMQDEIDKIDFDVAIIGAGSYGLPLAAYIKSKGKISIHMGGTTQILFGIKGKRWDTHPVISKFYNEHWIRPALSETVPLAKKVEDACYW